MERFAQVFAIPGDAEGHRTGLAGAPLGDACERAGVDRLTVLTAGSQGIVHYEGPDAGAAAAVAGDPALDGLLGPADEPLYEEIFAWSADDAPDRFERAGLILRLQEGREEAYREWLAGEEAFATLKVIWERNRIWRHDVLARGTSLVAYYECESRFNVLKAFREPEALVMLLTELSALMVLDPYAPFSLYEEAAAWGSRDRQAA